jgi:tetratricopeptide (TPR) repeat protein
VLILAAQAAQANSDDPKSRDDAQRRLEEGNSLFREGDYAGALRSYRQAREAFPSPKLWFNLARCEDKLHLRAAAMVHYARFLNEVPDADDEVRAEAEARTRVLETEIVEIDLVGVPLGARVEVDGRAEELPLSGSSLWAEPGKHHLLVIGVAGQSWTAPIDGPAGARLSVTVPALLLSGAGAKEISIESKQTAPPSLLLMPKPRPLYRRWWFWAGIGAAAVAAGVVAFTATRSKCPSDHCVAPWGS